MPFFSRFEIPNLGKSQMSDFTDYPIIEMETELYNGELFNKLACTQKSTVVGHYYCNGNPYLSAGYYQSESHKWIFKVPNVDEKIQIYWFRTGVDKIDLREFDVKCDDIDFNGFINPNSNRQNLSITDSIGEKHELEITFHLAPTCEDFIFNAE
jgi:hypothetical protein